MEILDDLDVEKMILKDIVEGRLKLRDLVCLYPCIYIQCITRKEGEPGTRSHVRCINFDWKNLSVGGENH